MLGTVLIVVLLLVLLGSWPSWPYSRDWGYYPSSTIGLILVVIVVLALLGRIVVVFKGGAVALVTHQVEYPRHRVANLVQQIAATLLLLAAVGGAMLLLASS